MAGKSPFLILGLGNPGREYENTKHNVGFVTVDVLAERLGIKVNKLKCRALIGDGRVGSEKVLLAKPQTYMNESGVSVRMLLAYYDIPMERMLVIYDDVDIPVGSVRIREKGSAGSHNGMRSILYQLRDEGFARVRIGIGAERGEMPLHAWVLSGFSKEHLEPVRAAILRAADAAESIVREGTVFAMNRYNG
jgi:PTH1 family peptidyl-tRNA hydrolase